MKSINLSLRIVDAVSLDSSKLLCLTKEEYEFYDRVIGRFNVIYVSPYINNSIVVFNLNTKVIEK